MQLKYHLQLWTAVTEDCPFMQSFRSIEHNFCSAVLAHYHRQLRLANSTTCRPADLWARWRRAFCSCRPVNQFVWGKPTFKWLLVAQDFFVGVWDCDIFSLNVTLCLQVLSLTYLLTCDCRTDALLCQVLLPFSTRVHSWSCDRHARQCQQGVWHIAQLCNQMSSVL